MSRLFSDLILYNGYIFTLNEKNPTSSALAVKEDKIVLLGSDTEIIETKGETTQVIDLKGRTVLPGFIDTHIHPSMAGDLQKSVIDFKTSKPESISELLQIVKNKVESVCDGEWITGWGYDDQRFVEKRHPNRFELDQVSNKNPVFLVHTCGHIAVCNSLGLNIGGIDKNTDDPKQGKIDRDFEGEPTGILRNRAQKIIKKHLTQKDDIVFKENLRLALKKLASWGVTTIHDAWSGSNAIKAYQELLRNNKLPIRVGLMPPIANEFEGDYLNELTSLQIRTGFGDNKLKIVGVKVAVDGMIRSETAALFNGYFKQSENKGLITIDIDELNKKIIKCNSNGLRACIHAEGDRGISVALDAIETALNNSPHKDHRHRIEHFGLCDLDQIDRMKALGVVPSVSINFVYDIGEGYEQSLGTNRCNHVYPMKSLIEKGIYASCNSDWPVSEGNPLIGIYSAVTRNTWKGNSLGSNQKISITEAIKSYTYNGAYAAFEETEKGTLEVNKLADMIVLSENIFTTPVENILKIKVDITIVGGKVVYKRE
ncbi:amidohydrolase [Thermoproteota archaeon]